MEIRFLREKPNAGNQHAAPMLRSGVTGRLDEGEGAPARPRRGSFLSRALIGFFCAWSVCALGGEGLRPAAMTLLPPGAIRPEGHLLATLERQRDGLTGHAEELYDDIGHSDWLTNAGKGGQYAWERGPYFARGLVALAFALDDSALKARAKTWVDAALNSQKPDGDIGPRARTQIRITLFPWTQAD